MDIRQIVGTAQEMGKGGNHGAKLTGFLTENPAICVVLLG